MLTNDGNGLSAGFIPGVKERERIGEVRFVRYSDNVTVLGEIAKLKRE